MRKLSNFLEKSQPIYEVMQYIFLVILTFYIFFPKPILVGIYIFSIFLMFMSYILYKDYSNNPERTWNIFTVIASLSIISVPLYLLRLLEVFLNVKIPIGIKLMFSFGMIILCIVLLFVDNKKKRMKMDEIRVKETLLGKKGVAPPSEHDIDICIDAESGETAVLKRNDRFLHVITYGPTGCGKTSQVLIPMLNQDIRKKHGVIVMEPKKDLALKAYAMDIYYNPDEAGLYFDPTEPDCPSLNPLDGPEDLIIEKITTIFEMLTADSQTYFKDIANNVLRNSIKMIKRLEYANMNFDTGISSSPATLIRLNDVLTNTGNRGRDAVAELRNIPTHTDDEKKENEDIASWFIDVYYADRSVVWQNSSGVRTQVYKLISNKHLRRVLNPENGKSDIDFTDIIENEKRLFITTAQGELLDLNKYLGFFIMFSIQAAIINRPGNENTRKPCYLYLDEFQTYANQGFSIVLQQGRSYRVSAILATQSRNAIKMDMGSVAGEAFLSVISTNARSQIIFPGIDPEDAKYYSVAFGEREEEVIQKGETHAKFEFGHGMNMPNFPTESTRTTIENKPYMTATDIGYKKFQEVSYKLMKDSSVTFARKGISSFINEELNQTLDEISEKHVIEQKTKRDEIEQRIAKAKEDLYRNYQVNKNGGNPTMAQTSEGGIPINNKQFGNPNRNSQGKDSGQDKDGEPKDKSKEEGIPENKKQLGSMEGVKIQ